MKKLFSFLIMSPMFISMVYTQTLSDYISEIKGDTLVIKDYFEMENKENSLYQALTLDTGIVSSERVYKLKTNGYYPLINNPTTIRKTIIVGEDNTILVNNVNSDLAAPLICGTSGEGILTTGGINIANDIIVKNCNLVLGNLAGSIGWSFFNTDSSNLKIVVDNCLFERTLWVFLVGSKNSSVTLRNCYFVNMSGHPNKRNGGVFDSFSDVDTLLVENCTHIMASGNIYWLRDNYKFNRIIFNHNTFVNSSGYVFMNRGDKYNISLTNNIFVNCNIHSFSFNLIAGDFGYGDPEGLPIGFVNIYPDSAIYANSPIKFLCQNNLVYWHPSLENMDSILNANAVNGMRNWESQMIIMNKRTEKMFKYEEPYNTTLYSHLVTDTWREQMPTFTDTKDLLTTQLANLKTYALTAVDLNNNETLPTWRVVNTRLDDFINPDWPIPVDLSYSDEDLLTAGIGGFPIGDLNWFPTKKAEWLEQKNAEYNTINEALNKGELVTTVQNQEKLASQFQLYQNYPNPFNPTTTIKYDLPKESEVKIIIYDILGKEVATLVNEKKNAGKYEISWNANRFASGVYFYELQMDKYRSFRKLLLLK